MLTATALVLAACGGGEVGGDADRPSDADTTVPTATDAVVDASPETAPETTPQTTPDSTSAESSDDTEVDGSTDVDSTIPSTDPPVEPGVFDEEATVLLDEFVFLDENTYRVNTLGTPLSLVVDRPLFVQPNSDGFFAVTHPESVGPDDDDIVMMRASVLSDPTEPNRGFPFGDNVWPVDDVLGWVDNLVDNVEATTPERTTLGGLPAIRFDLEVGDIECSSGPQECVGFASDQTYNTKYLNPGVGYRIWVVEQAEEAPIVVIVGSLDADGAWFETAEAVLANVAFGDVHPSPIRPVPAGPTELDLLDGIQIDFGLDATLVRDRKYLRLGNQAMGTSFVQRLRSEDGGSWETVDDVVAQIQVNGAELDEVEPTAVDGIPTRVFEVAAPEPGGPVLFFGADVRRNWFVPTLGTIWLIEHPERGLLMVTAESYLDVPDLRDSIRDQIASALSTLSFIETS